MKITFSEPMIFSCRTDFNVNNILFVCLEFLTSKTVRTLVDPNAVTVGKVSKKYPDVGYAIGWSVKPKCLSQPYTVSHTG